MADATSTDVAKVEAETHDEIDDIMAEIEKIKSGISTGAATPAPVAQTAPVEAAPEASAAVAEPVAEVDFGSANTEAPMEEMLASAGVEEASGGALAGAEVEETHEVEESQPEVEAPQVAQRVESPVSASVVRPVFQSVPAPAPRAAGEGALSMTLTGAMRLSLKYEQDGQEVSVSFTDQFLMVSLADGTEFKIPVARAAKRAAA